MIILLEGINNAGKTTFASYLSGIIDHRIIRINDVSHNKGLSVFNDLFLEFGFRGNDFFEDMVVMEFMKQSNFHDVILDRSIVSSYVYRKLKTGFGLPSDFMKWFFLMLRDNHGIVLNFKIDYNLYVKRYNSNKNILRNKLLSEIDFLKLEENYSYCFSEFHSFCPIVDIEIKENESVIDYFYILLQIKDKIEKFISNSNNVGTYKYNGYKEFLDLILSKTNR
jgi:thymidylate kinase